MHSSFIIFVAEMSKFEESHRRKRQAGNRVLHFFHSDWVLFSFSSFPVPSHRLLSPGKVSVPGMGPLTPACIFRNAQISPLGTAGLAEELPMLAAFAKAAEINNIGGVD